MGKNLVKAYPLRLEEELMDKLKVIAKKEDRNVREQITKIVRDYVLKYEMQNGFIDTSKAEHIHQITQDAIKTAEYYKKQEAKREEKRERKNTESLTPNIADLH